MLILCSFLKTRLLDLVKSRGEEGWKKKEKMRPHEREQDPSPSESSPTPSASPPRPAGNLSSLVVRPPATSGGDFESGELSHRLNSPALGSHPHRRRSPPPSDLHRRRGEPPTAFRRRGESPVGFHRRGSPQDFRRRGGGGSPLPFHHPRSHRFRDNPGYLPRAGSISPPSRHPRLNDSHYDPSFDRPAGPHFGRVFRGGRGGGRFRDVSPRNSLGRGNKSFGRGYTVDQRGISPVEGEYVHRNDPNLSPREGDWICGNPRCGNLNFARRTYCNNCEEPRFATARAGPIHSPRRGYFTSPPPRGSPPGVGGPPISRGARSNFNGGYRSPPRGWESAEDPRDFGTGSHPPRSAGKFQDHMRGDNRVEYEDECRGRGNWPVAERWDRRDGFIPERRGYDRRPPSPLPHDRGTRERSRSPMGSRLLKGSYVGRGRDDRRYDDSYLGRGHVDESEMGLGRGRGRGFRRTNDSFIGRGRGGRRGVGRGRNNTDVY